MNRQFTIGAAVALALPLGAGRAAAQPSSFDSDARPGVPLAEALAMGDAVTAVPSGQTAFFANPAHLARLPVGRVRIQVAGAGGAVGGNTMALADFVLHDLDDAIDRGLDSLRANDRGALEALYDRAFEVGGRTSSAGATAFGPQLQVGLGPLGAGAVGAFGHSGGQFRFDDAGGGVPRVDYYQQADVIVPVVAAARVPGTPLAVGAAASYTRRYVTAKYAVVDELDPDGEGLYVLTASAVTFDAGIHAEDVGVPGLAFGLAVHRLVGGRFDYRYDRRIDLTGGGFADDTDEIAELEARFNGRGAEPQFRAGAAYRLPLAAGPLLRDVTVAADYVGASTSAYDQTTAAKLRFGAAAHVGGVLALRAGLSQGYPSLGAGLALPFVRLDYAYFSVEDGRVPGQLRRASHLVQLRFGLF